MNGVEYNTRIPAPITLTDVEFVAIKDLIQDKFGVHLNEQKRSLVTGRLLRTLQEGGFDSFTQYIRHIKSDRTGRALIDLVNNITTNHTYFYREYEHFEFMMKRALPEITRRLEKEMNRDIRIWCAGCSTGEEAYMLGMLIMEFLGADYPNWRAGVLATDISNYALRFAQKGMYQKEQLDRLPMNFRVKYFQRCSNDEYSVSTDLAREVVFRRFNLISETFPFKKPFHIIFCRNVMIYFDQPTRENLVNKFYNLTEPGGYFFIGMSESIRNDANSYKYVQPAVYNKPL